MQETSWCCHSRLIGDPQVAGRQGDPPKRRADNLCYKEYNMHYTYVLFSLKSKRLYVGYTDNLKRRLKEHNTGNGGAYSKKNAPFVLIFYEAFLSKKDASKQEMFYKSGYGREVLNSKIDASLASVRV